MNRTAVHRPQAGFTLVELLMGMVVFVVAAVVLGDHIASNYATTNTQKDQVFAYTKAQAILSEIHALVDRGDVEAAVDLDVLDDGVVPRPALTVGTDGNGVLLAPDHPLSGNVLRRGEWVWARQISVRPFAGLDNRNVRYVTVRILKRRGNGLLSEMATLSSVVNSISTSFPATQVFDVYLLAVENVPGWWVFMEAIVPFVESAITDLENRNPGLSVRTHWISKLGFGRDRVYRPYINEDVDSHQTVNDVYYYPGLMPSGNASTFYYVPDLIKGRIAVDGVERNGYDSNDNPYPYALADFYNHCMRYPRARELYEHRARTVRDREDAIRVAQLNGSAAPDPLDDMSAEPPLQVLLEEMCSNPDEYRHALLINLHGELLPSPPLRNYSDPAKCPERLPGVRVVAHPEELRTASPDSTDPHDKTVRLRVYAYKTDPADTFVPDVMPGHHPIVLQVMDLDLTDYGNYGRLAPGVELESLRGGVDVAGDFDYYPMQAARSYLDPHAPNEMFYGAWFVTPGAGQRPYTLIALYNTPLVTPPIGDRGLRQNQRSRLYGMEYVPSSPQADDFAHDLYDLGDGPKNTARWRLSIPEDVWVNRRFVDEQWPPSYYDPRDLGEQSVMVTFRTRIWDPFLPDPMMTGSFPEGTVGRLLQPENFSETYTWWATTRDAVPFTERFQFHGDPRHNPYKDLLAGAFDFPDGYNWFFDSLTNNSQNAAQDFPGIVRRWNLWNGGPAFDIPRVMQLFRTALVECQAIYTTLSGYSYYYVGCGNDIGYDAANGYSNSIPVNRKPWGGSDTATGFTNNITGSRALVRSGGSDYWWGMPWLGELYPDWAYSTDWFTPDINGFVRGNLASGTAATQFHRQNGSTVHANQGRFRAFGTRAQMGHQRTNTRGCVSFFNVGTSSSHFNHHSAGANGNLVGPGIELRDNYGFPIPNQAYITRPFTVNTGGNVPPEYNLEPYSSERFSARILETFFDHGSGRTGSGLVELESPDGTSAAWIVVNGLAQTTETGSSFLAKYCLLSMYQSYFELGDPALTHRIEQPPRIEIASPTEITELRDPASIPIQIELGWMRWDRLPYTTTTAPTFTEDESNIVYVILYSRDNGVTWQHVQDDSLAIIGQRPNDPLLEVADSGPGPEIYLLDTPSVDFPEGTYQLRVEAYRQNQSLHYSVHQVRIYVQR